MNFPEHGERHSTRRRTPGNPLRWEKKIHSLFFCYYFRLLRGGRKQLSSSSGVLYFGAHRCAEEFVFGTQLALGDGKIAFPGYPLGCATYTPKRGSYSSLLISEADVKQDRHVITRALQEFLNSSANERRFDWLYCASPHGTARTWIGHTQGKQAPVALAAAFPRRMYTATGIERTWVLGDFCIAPKYRSAGPALQLQRACLAGISDARWYDFPSISMAALYKRLGLAPHCYQLRFVKPLRFDRKLGKYLGNQRLGRLLAKPGNLLLLAREKARPSYSGFSVDFQREPFGDEFSALAAAVGARYGTCAERSADFLNWRYREHPLVQHEILVARHTKSLRCCVVFTHEKDQLRIVDLFGWLELAEISSLLRGLVQVALDRRVNSIAASFVAGEDLVRILRFLGFHPRESSPLFMGRGDATIASEACFLSDGDRES